MTSLWTDVNWLLQLDSEANTTVGRSVQLNWRVAIVAEIFIDCTTSYDHQLAWLTLAIAQTVGGQPLWRIKIYF